MKALQNYLSKTPRDHAFLLYGSWGAGKTHQWNQFSRTLDGLAVITISAAGLQTREDLDQALFQQSIAPPPGSPEGILKEAGTVLGRAALRWVKIEPKDITFRADLTPGKTVVCIDDVERFRGDFSILFGFVISLLDADKIHVILIADDERAAESTAYAKYKERIVASYAHVTPDITNFVENELKAIVDQPTREALLRHSKEIAEGFIEWKFTNLRTVRATIDELQSIVEAAQPNKSTYLNVRPLLSALAFWKKSVAVNAATAPLIARAFKAEHINYLVAAQHREDRGAENEPAKNVIDQGFEKDSAYWGSSEELAKLARGLDADRAAIVADFELAVVELPPEPHYILKRYWAFEQSSVTEAGESLIKLLSSLEFKSTDELYAAYRSLHNAARERIIPNSEDDVINLALEAISKCSPENVHAVDIDDYIGMDGVLSHEVVNALRALSGRIEEHVSAVEKEDSINQLLTRGELTSDNMLKPIFASVNPAYFVSRLVDLPPTTVHQVAVAVSAKMRLNGGRGVFAEEAEFARTAAELLNEHVPDAETLTPHQAQLRVISTQLQRFAAIAEERTH